MSIGFSHTRHRDELEGAREYDADTYAGHVPDLVNHTSSGVQEGVHTPDDRSDCSKSWMNTRNLDLNS